MRTSRKTATGTSPWLLVACAAAFVTAGSRPACASPAPTPAARSCDAERALYSRATGLWERGQHLISAVHFSQLSADPCDPRRAARALYAYALNLSELGETQETLSALIELRDTDQPELRRRAALLEAFLFPEIRSRLEAPADRLRFRLWDARSESAFEEILAGGTSAGSLESGASNRLAEIHREYLNRPRKSPGLAAISSAILPGAGQAYVGAWQSAAVALALNALFAATTIEFARKDLVAPAIASGVVFSITYLGNILNAANAAKKYTESARAEPERRLYRAIFPEFTPE